MNRRIQNQLGSASAFRDVQGDVERAPMLLLDDNILLLQLIGDGKLSTSSSSPSFQARTREFIDIGFRIVGNISKDIDSSLLGDLTADYCVYNGAIILQASLRSLLTNARVQPDKSFKFQ